MKQYKITFEIKEDSNDYFGNRRESRAQGTTILQAKSDREAFALANQLYASCSNWEIKGIEPTCELVKELATRVGVQDIVVEPYQPIKIEVDGEAVQCDVKNGPCHIMVIYD